MNDIKNRIFKIVLLELRYRVNHNRGVVAYPIRMVIEISLEIPGLNLAGDIIYEVNQKLAASSKATCL